MCGFYTGDAHTITDRNNYAYMSNVASSSAFANVQVFYGFSSNGAYVFICKNRLQQEQKLAKESLVILSSFFVVNYLMYQALVPTKYYMGSSCTEMAIMMTSK